MFEDKYKPHQKHSETTVNKTKWRESQWHQPELPFYGRSKEEYYSHISSKAPQQLTEQEVNDLFWNILINLGWRLNTHSNGERRIVFACPKCEMIIDDCPYDKLLMKDANVMRDKNNLDRLLIMHNGKPCFPVGDLDE